MGKERTNDNRGLYRSSTMTNKNAIKQLNMLKEHLKNDAYADDINALNKGIDALEKLEKLKKLTAKYEPVEDKE